MKDTWNLSLPFLLHYPHEEFCTSPTTKQQKQKHLKKIGRLRGSQDFHYKTGEFRAEDKICRGEVKAEKDLKVYKDLINFW